MFTALRHLAFRNACKDVNVDGEMVFPVAHALRKKGPLFLFFTGYDIPGIWPVDLRGIRRLSKPVNPRESYNALGIRAS